MTGITRVECDAAIRASLEGLQFEGIDDLLAEAGIDALPYDERYLDAVIARFKAVLTARLRVIEAESKRWAAIADAASREATKFAIEFERFCRLAVSRTVHWETDMPEDIDKLKADLAAANAKVAEFRSTNVALLKSSDELGKELVALKEQLAGLDPAKVRADLAELATLRQQPPADAGRIAALEAQLAAATAAAAGATLRTLVGDVFLKTGGRPEAVEYVLSKARDLFDVKDGQIEARVFSPTRPGEKLSIDEFIAAQTKASAFAFFPSSGGGASPNPGPSSPRGGVREVVDPTPAELGQLADAIKSGAVRLRFTK